MKSTEKVESLWGNNVAKWSQIAKDLRPKSPPVQY